MTSVSLLVTMRPVVSSDEPADCAKMTRTGRVGYDCAGASYADTQRSEAPNAARIRVMTLSPLSSRADRMLLHCRHEMTRLPPLLALLSMMAWLAAFSPFLEAAVVRS